MGNTTSTDDDNAPSEFDSDNIIQKSMTEDIQADEWDDYKVMLNSLDWKKIPDTFENMDTSYPKLYKFLQCVKDKTKNTPSKIRNLSGLKKYLKDEYSTHQVIIQLNMDIEMAYSDVNEDIIPQKPPNRHNLPSTSFGNEYDHVCVDQNKRKDECGCVIL